MMRRHNQTVIVEAHPEAPPEMALRLVLSADAFDPLRLVTALPALASERLALELVSDAGDVSLLIWARKKRLYELQGLLLSCFPSLVIEPVSAPVFGLPAVGWRLRPRLADSFPLVST